MDSVSRILKAMGCACAILTLLLGTIIRGSEAKAAYGINYARLVALKDKYDPTNFFRMNQNIKPSLG